MENIENEIMLEDSVLDEGIPTNSIFNDRPGSGIVGIKRKHVKAMEKVESAWWEILNALHDAYDLDIDDPNFSETPKRISRMMILERCNGINSDELCKQLFDKNFPAMGKKEDDQLVITTNPAIVYSICPHHFENVEYHVWTGYIPDQKFIGISKFSRVVDLYARQPILQESYTSGLADLIFDNLNPKGCMVVVKGWHDCMIARGAKSNPNQCMVTSALRGIFSEAGQNTFKEEFIELCKKTGL